MTSWSKSRLQGCIPDSSNLSELDTGNNSSSHEQTDVPIQISTLWIGHDSKDLHKVDETGGDISKTPVSLYPDILHLHNLLLMAESKELFPSSKQAISGHTREIGLHPEIKEVHSGSLAAIRNPDSLTMTILLLIGKLLKIQKESRHMMNKGRASARNLAHMVNSTFLAVHSTPLHYRALKRLNNRISHNYTPLGQEAMKNLNIWIHNLQSYNKKQIKKNHQWTEHYLESWARLKS